MEITSRPQDRENPSPTHSPNSNGSSTNSSHNAQNPQIQTPPLTPKPTPRSETTTTNNNNNPYPTTFVQADTTNFKHVVQMLTGSSEPSKQSPDPPQSQSTKGYIPPIKTGAQKKQGFKLYERRNSLKNGLMISPSFGHNSGFSPRKQPEILSPSILNFPALVLSPVTPLIEDPFNKSSPSLSLGNSSSEEDRAIAEKGFYMHPSPRSFTPRGGGSEPQLLPLFPVTSPRVSGSSS